MTRRLVSAAVLLSAAVSTLSAFAQRPVVPAQGERPGTMLLTIFLRHDQSKTLDQIQAHIRETGFERNFPPRGVEVVSWYVVMGVGQVITLRLTPEKLREVNLAIETGAWGAFRTEFYPTYDYRSIWKEHLNRLEKK